MDRRQSLKWLGGLSAFVLPVVASGPSQAASEDKLVKPAKEWRDLLPPAAYRILFEEDTERAGSDAVA
ncbi:MAG TPA: peptide-methionine (R)-S-oxide reductase, partial [Accumulibacter sp.]|nr:peptide-methionine (R)-S-oxide reductase [Accumulibacter sp.]